MDSITGLLKKLTSPTKATADAYIEEIKDAESAPQSGQYSVEIKGDNLAISNVMSDEMNRMKETVYDLIKDIRDPEKPQTLEDLNVVSEENIVVEQFDKDRLLVKIIFVPTVPHCSLASIIGLCLRQKLLDCFPEKHKLDILVKKGTHETGDEINKQINDKERVTAAMENPNLRDLVQTCIKDCYG